MVTGWFVIEPPDTGVVGSTLPKATFAGVGQQPVTGGVAVAVPKISAALAGKTDPAGQIYATAQKAVATFFGTQTQTAAMASLLPKATMAGVGAQAQAGGLSAMAQKANAALTGTVINYGGLLATAQKASAAMAGSQTQSGAMAAAMQKATAAFFDGTAIGGAAATLARVSAAFNGYVEQRGDVAATLPKVTAFLGGLEHPMGTVAAQLPIAAANIQASQIIQSSSFAAALKIATAALSGGQAQAGTAGPTLKKASFAGASAAPVLFDQASTFTTGSTNQATWDVTCVISNVTAGAAIALMCVVPGAGGAFDINNSNYAYSITDANGSPTWTKRNWCANNNGSSNGGLIIFTAQNVNAGTHTIRLQQTVNNGSWVSVPMLCAISVTGVVSVVARETRGIYPGNQPVGSLSAPITVGANSLGILGVGTDAVQQTGIVNGTSRIAGGSNNTSGYYIFDFGMIITAPGVNPTVSAAANSQYHGWAAVEFVGA